METGIPGQALDEFVIRDPSDDRYTAADGQDPQDKTNDQPSESVFFVAANLPAVQQQGPEI
jgi:hypothetical protein